MSIGSNQNDILNVVRDMGKERLQDDNLFKNHFAAQFEAMVRQEILAHDKDDIEMKLYDISDRVCELIGSDVNGCCLEQFNLSLK